MRKGGRESELSRGTEEAGELAPGDPAEGSGEANHRSVDLEKVAITPLRERVHELGEDEPAFEALSASAAGDLPFQVQLRSESVI